MTLSELNFVRTDPKGYASARLTAGSDNGAIEYLQTYTGREAYTENSCMNIASRAYAKELGDNDRFSHSILDFLNQSSLPTRADNNHWRVAFPWRIHEGFQPRSPSAGLHNAAHRLREFRSLRQQVRL